MALLTWAANDCSPFRRMITRKVKVVLNDEKLFDTLRVSKPCERNQGHKVLLYI